MSGHDLEQTFVERSLADLATAAVAHGDGEGSGHSAPPPAVPPPAVPPSIAPPPTVPLPAALPTTVPPFVAPQPTAPTPAALPAMVPPSVAPLPAAPPPAALPTTMPPSIANPSPPPPNTRPIVGQTRLGPCLVTDIIGDGGMATVYRVWNEPLEVFRAVKLLSRAEYRSRFETEAKITAKLSHEGIVDIHSIGEWNGMPYMEMALVDGPTLQRILAERGKLPEIVCAAIVALVAKALDYAHSETYMLAGQEYCGIIHRDLKPANIMITASGAVKLIDFGIARPTQASLHTMEGNIAGTMYYLSPEQMDGGEVDNRSDIYSLGTILYEMATGAKTFPQESITELMKRKSSNKFKSPHEFSVNTSLANIIHRCLRRSPAKRYQHAQELADDLQKFCETMTTQAPKAIIEHYFSGAEEAIYADFGQAKTQRRSPRKWFLDKFSASGTPPKPPKEKLPVALALPIEIPDTTPNVPEAVEETPKMTEALPDDSQQVSTSAVATETVTTADSPTPTPPPKEPMAVRMPDKPAIAAPTPEKSQKTRTLDKPETAKPPKAPKEPKPPKPPRPPRPPKPPKAPWVKPMAAKLSETLKTVRASIVSMCASAIPACKTAISARPVRIAGIALLVLFAVFSLSYITVKTIQQQSSKKQLEAKAFADMDTTLDTTALAAALSTEPDSVVATADAPPDSVKPIPPPVPNEAALKMEKENESIRTAAAASRAGRWGQVIETLEPGDAYKNQNDLRTLYLLNAYVESRQFGKAQAIIDTISHKFDAYFLLCNGKLKLYQGSSSQAVEHFKSVLAYPSIVETDGTLHGTALYFIADIMQEKFNATPTALNRSSALGAWRKVSQAFASEPNDPRAERAEREISALSTEQSP